MRNEVFICWLTIWIRRKVWIEDRPLGIMDEVYTCRLAIWIRREVKIQHRTLGTRTEVFKCWLPIWVRREAKIEDRSLGSRTEVFTCWLPIWMRREVRIEDRALGTRAEVNRRRWLSTNFSWSPWEHCWIRSGKWDEFSSFFCFIMFSRWFYEWYNQFILIQF